MVAHVVREHRGAKSWWWFFTIPHVYSVWWEPDGVKTMRQFLDEQTALVAVHLKETGHGVAG